MKAFLRSIFTKYEIILLLLIAAVLRFYFLDNKPPHHDEAINGWFINKMWEDGFFNYDPTNYHGPFLFYLFQMTKFIFGYGIIPMRAMTALFNLLTIIFVLYWFYNNKLNLSLGGLNATKGKQVSTAKPFFAAASAERWIGWALALSPAMIFYSRSAIHESFFVFFQVVFFAGCANIFFAEEKSQRHTGFLYLIIGFFGCLANKETFVLNILAALIACVIIFYRDFLKPAQLSKEIKNILKVYFSEHNVQNLFYITLAIFVLLYSGFGRDLNSIADFFNAFLPWTKTGVGGAGHNKPFMFWAELIAKYEAFSLIGLLLSLSIFFKLSQKTKWAIVFAVILAVIYSAIPYKTPWCLMSIIWPFMFVLGFVIEDFSAEPFEISYRKGKAKNTKEKIKQTIVFSKWLNNKYLTSLFIFVSALPSLYWTYDTSIKNPINMKHAFVYVQTQYDVNAIIANLNNSINPLKWHQKILISTEEGWPFPWILENYSAVSYQPVKLLTDFDFEGVSIALVDDGQQAIFDKRLKGEFWKCKVQIRDSRIDAYIYFNKKDYPDIIDLKPEYYVAGDDQ